MFPSEIKTEEQIQEAIISVVVFFDLFDYPLTNYEIWKYLDYRLSLLKIDESLTYLKSLNELDSKDGLFFLKNRSEIIISRQKRHNYTQRKIKIAKRFSKIFSLLPWVKTVILSNSIGQFNLRDGSDIDFFIICSPRRIWLTRFFCAGVAALLNSRPKLKNKRDKICLSFYITTDNLNLDSLKLPGGDPYFFYWLRSFILLYNKDGVYEKFLAANNLVISNECNGIYFEKERDVKQNIIISQFEKIIKTIQYIIMSPALKKAINNSIGVVVNDNILKLYLFDNRREYAKKYGNRLEQIIKKNN